MRSVAKDDWETYHPITNVMVRGNWLRRMTADYQWIHYILRYILKSKKLVKPRPAKAVSRIPGSPIKTRRVPLTRRAPAKDAVEMRTVQAGEMLGGMDVVLTSFINGVKGTKRFGSAGDIWKYGQMKGWVL